MIYIPEISETTCILEYLLCVAKFLIGREESQEEAPFSLADSSNLFGLSPNWFEHSQKLLHRFPNCLLIQSFINGPTN